MPILTADLRNLQRQLDEAFPDRRRPDGEIGDGAHRSRTSGHNPDDTPGSNPAWDGDPDDTPEIRALDVSADLGPGVSSSDLVDHLVELPGLSSVLRYIIHRGLIYHVRDAFAGVPYGGSNPHNDHIHFEGAWSQAADNNNRFDFRLEMIPVALTAADKKWLSEEIRKVVTGDADPTDREYSLGGLVAITERRTAEIRDTVNEINAKLPQK